MDHKSLLHTSATDDCAHLSVELPAQPSLRPVTHLLAGAAGGFATAILTSPLDVLRTRLQSDIYKSPQLARQVQASQSTLFRPTKASLRHLRETLQIARTVYYTEGWRGFYRGLGPSLTGVVPATAIKFYVYGNCKGIVARLLGCKRDAAIVHTTSAIAAGIATSTATNPIWLIKTRLQLDDARTNASTERRYKNSLDCLRQVLKQEGARGLFRGLSASYLGTIETALHLVMYEQLKVIIARSLQRVKTSDNPVWIEFALWVSTSGAAGSAKLAAGLIAYPHEVVRTRLRQAPKENGAPKYSGLFQCFRSVAKQEGMIGLYGGLLPHILRSIPSAIVTLGVYESVLRLVRS